MATFVITAGDCDAKEDTGTVVVTGNGADHDHDATGKWSGLRFVPSAGANGAGPGQGATITAASISLCISTTGSDEPNVAIFGEKVVNSAAFTTAASNISGRTKTTANVNWASTDLGAAANQFFSTSDLTTVVQELVNQASWTTTSPITFLIQGDATNAGGGAATSRDLQYRFYEYTGTGGLDPAGTYSAVLTLTWTGGGSQSNAPRMAFYRMMGES